MKSCTYAKSRLVSGAAGGMRSLAWIYLIRASSSCWRVYGPEISLKIIKTLYEGAGGMKSLVWILLIRASSSCWRVYGPEINHKIIKESLWRGWHFLTSLKYLGVDPELLPGSRFRTHKMLELAKQKLWGLPLASWKMLSNFNWLDKSYED